MNKNLIFLSAMMALMLAPLGSAGAVETALNIVGNATMCHPEELNCMGTCNGEDDPVFQTTCTVYLVGYYADDVASDCVPTYEKWNYESCCKRLYGSDAPECKPEDLISQ